MEKEKLITLIEMLEHEIESIITLPKVGHRALGAVYLIEHIKSALCDKVKIDLEEISAQLEFLEKAKKKSEKELIKEIQNTDEDKLNDMALAWTLDTVLHSQNRNDEQIDKEGFHYLKEYHLFLLKNGLIGKPIQTIEYEGYHAQQFSNFNILFSKENGESMFCNYYKKANKQDLKRLIDDIKLGKIKTKV